jgi:hypothetical protein
VRPDLVFDRYPKLGCHPCAGYLQLHATRAPTEPASEAIMLEPLSAFAPGL